jgi:hypothetical protein
LRFKWYTLYKLNRSGRRSGTKEKEEIYRKNKETIPINPGVAVPVRKSDELVSNAKAGAG